MPLGDDLLVIHYVLPRKRTDIDYHIMICMPDASVCGRRKVDPDLYDPDLCQSEYDGQQVELEFTPTHFSNHRIEAGAFSSNGPPGSDGIKRSGCNDLPYVDMTIPPAIEIVSPAPDTSISRAAQSNIRAEWSPPAKSFPIHWKLIPVDNEVEELPCDQLSWQRFEGDGDDTGFVDIPTNILPNDLPPEGCEVILTVARIQMIDPPEGIANALLKSTAVDGLILRVLP